MWRRTTLLAVAAGLALPGAAEAARGPCVSGERSSPSCRVWTADVRSVNDGDTMDVDVRGDGSRASRRVRFTGVQAMELTNYRAGSRRGDCGAVAATERVEQLVRRGRGRVRLAAQDPGSRAQGRLLRTVAVRRGGRWRDVGATLMREGLGLWWPGWTEWAPNRRYSINLQKAIAEKRGIFAFGACGAEPSPGVRLQLWANWDENDGDPADEWIRIRNLDPVRRVALARWYVRDGGLRRFTFPAHASVGPGETVTVDVGSEGDGVTEFAWNREAPIFSDPTSDEKARGDGAYLFDPLGAVRAATVFPCRTACTDPLRGALSVEVDPLRRSEHVALTNVTGVAVDLFGYVLKASGRTYDFPAGSVVPPGATLYVHSVADPLDDTALDKGMGRLGPILRDAGGEARLLTYTDITVGCAAWGDGAC